MNGYTLFGIVVLLTGLLSLGSEEVRLLAAANVLTGSLLIILSRTGWHLKGPADSSDRIER